VEMVAESGELVLLVTDDGTGIRTKHPESGLRNVRQRAEKLGGLVSLTAHQPHGTILEWRVPLS